MKIVRASDTSTGLTRGNAGKDKAGVEIQRPENEFLTIMLLLCDL